MNKLTPALSLKTPQLGRVQVKFACLNPPESDDEEEVRGRFKLTVCCEEGGPAAAQREAFLGSLQSE